MNTENLKNILLAIVGSLSSFLFYGYIETADTLDKVDTRLLQAESELDDIWEKYNTAQTEKLEFYKEFRNELDKKRDK